MKNIVLKKVTRPEYDEVVPVFYTDETMVERQNKVLECMKESGYDAIVVYCDLEHSGNFEYLTGFVTRFEESLLVMHQDGKTYLLLGNENYPRANIARIKVEGIHVPHFSLPNQPMDTEKTFVELLAKSGLNKEMKVGLVGWKMFTSSYEDNHKLFDIPYFITKGIKDLVGYENMYNATNLFIGGSYGVRTTNNANEIAHYEFGAALASSCMLKAMDEVEIGKSELEIASRLNSFGQDPTVVTICSTGERFEKANLYPSAKKVKLGDKISLTVGYRGGLQSRAGYAVSDSSELGEADKDYLKRIAIPYYGAIVTWLENIHIGMVGKDMYQLIEEVLPKKDYNWFLNPGHLTAEEEWLSSPIHKESNEVLKSGMIFQVDIIPSVKGLAGASVESTIALANEELKADIAKQYPELSKRFEKRREFIEKVLGIKLSKDVLVMGNALAYLRPFLLDRDLALVVEQ